ncbi:type II inositol-1,4,5-trisphosphate 5-phosphatase [Xylariaceae sp. FL0804]|nr:type II inositol-1,4,5-trisphosphate 5-phosphatase [Xylariaceae sp. FL0804]
MPATDREPSVASAQSEPVDLASTTHYSLSRAVHARRAEYTRPHRIRIKIGSWNVAGCPGTDKDLARWFVDGDGVEPQLDSNLATLDVSENNAVDIRKPDTATETKAGQGTNTTDAGVDGARDNAPTGTASDPALRLMGGDSVGLYVLGLQEIVSLNLVHQSFYSDPGSIAKWQDALEAALPRGYRLVASQQLVGLLLLMYASPEVADTVSNESTVAVGTGLLGYMGNKGAVTSRILLGETTRLVFANCHLSSGHDQTSLDRRCWDYGKVISQTKFAPISQHGVAEDEGEGMGQEDFAFCFGDLNFRLDGLPGDDIRRLLTLHTRGEYGATRDASRDGMGNDGVIIMHNSDDEDPEGTRTPGMVSRETSFKQPDADDENVQLPDPDDFMPDPHDDPASLQATLDSLLPHDQLSRMIKERKAFHEGWQEGGITFLPTYKYDVGTVGLFDSSEKKRAPSWCDRILFRTRKHRLAYEERCKDEVEAKEKDEDMKKRGIDQAADDENVLFDYDPEHDASTDSLAAADSGFGYDEYDDADDEGEEVTTKDGFVDEINLDLYTSHQRVMSSDHKPLVAMFTLRYDAVVPGLKARIHAEVARDLDRAENEGRPGITIIVDRRPSVGDQEGTADGSEGADLGDVGFLREQSRSLTIANTGRVPAKFTFVEKPVDAAGVKEKPEWLRVKFVRSSDENDGEQDAIGTELSLDPGETVTAVVRIRVDDLEHVRALNDGSSKLEDVLILRVTEGRDHFIPVRATWLPSCFGRSLEELIRIPRGGIRAMAKEGPGGAIPDSLPVHSSSPTELFKLTEAVETLTERVIADENMLDDCKVPRDRAGWPFDEDSWQSSRDDDYDSLRIAIVEALEEDQSILDALKADVPAAKRLEVVGEVLLLFLRGMTDGVVTASLWQEIEQGIPNLAGASASAKGSSSGSGAGADDTEKDKAAVLDMLSAAPYHNISFVFLTSMLARVANELVPLSKQETDALLTKTTTKRAGRPVSTTVTTLGRRSLSFRRSTTITTTGSAAAGAAAAGLDLGVLQRRLAWERRTAEILGVAMCRRTTTTAAPGASAKEKKAAEEKMRGLLEIFLRRTGGA